MCRRATLLVRFESGNRRQYEMTIATQPVAPSRLLTLADRRTRSIRTRAAGRGAAARGNSSGARARDAPRFDSTGGLIRANMLATEEPGYGTGLLRRGRLGGSKHGSPTGRIPSYPRWPTNETQRDPRDPRAVGVHSKIGSKPADCCPYVVPRRCPGDGYALRLADLLGFSALEHAITDRKTGKLCSRRDRRLK